MDHEEVFVGWHQVDGGEQFCISGYVFDVNIAKDILIQTARPNSLVKMADLKSLAGFISTEETDKEINLNVPLIIAQFTTADGHQQVLPIDGWHRIKKAIKDGLETLPCVVLTARETKRVIYARA